MAGLETIGRFVRKKKNPRADRVFVSNIPQHMETRILDFFAPATERRSRLESSLNSEEWRGRGRRYR